MLTFNRMKSMALKNLNVCWYIYLLFRFWCLNIENVANETAKWCSRVAFGWCAGRLPFGHICIGSEFEKLLDVLANPKLTQLESAPFFPLRNTTSLPHTQTSPRWQIDVGCGRFFEGAAGDLHGFGPRKTDAKDNCDYFPDAEGRYDWGRGWKKIVAPSEIIEIKRDKFLSVSNPLGRRRKRVGR